MKAKVTKTDGTIVELEGEPLDLVILLPDLKGYDVMRLPYIQYIPAIPPEPVKTITITGTSDNTGGLPAVKCICSEPWFGIFPPDCPIHGQAKTPTTTTGTLF